MAEKFPDVPFVDLLKVVFARLDDLSQRLEALDDQVRPGMEEAAQQEADRIKAENDAYWAKVDRERAERGIGVVRTS